MAIVQTAENARPGLKLAGLLLLLLAIAPATGRAQSSPAISIVLSPGHMVPKNTAITATVTLENLDPGSYSSLVFRADLTEWDQHFPVSTSCEGEDTGEDIPVEVNASQETFTVEVWKSCSANIYAHYTLDAALFRLDSPVPGDKVELASAHTRFAMSRYLEAGEIPAPAAGVAGWLDPDPTSFEWEVGEWVVFRTRTDILQYLNSHVGVHGYGPEGGALFADFTYGLDAEEACQNVGDGIVHWRRAIHQPVWIIPCKVGEAVIDVWHETDPEILSTYEFRIRPAGGEGTTPAVRVSTTALTVHEGGSGTYTVELASQPTGNVTITPSVTGDDDVKVSGTLTITSSNWGTAQTVTVSADDDADTADEMATVSHAVAGANYGSVTAASVDVTVTDNDSPVTPTIGSDLVVHGPIRDDSTREPGETFWILVTVQNQGIEWSSATTVRFYRSTDVTITTSDTAEGTEPVSPLRPSAGSGNAIPLTAPSTTGTYYYGACVDVVPGESDTTNNCSNKVMRVDVRDGGDDSGGPSVPSAPASLTATAGDEVVTLVWSAPADDGGAPITGYEYRYAARSSVPENTPWQAAGLNLERTVTGLASQQYAFEVRARNRVGNGEARVALATPVGRPSAPASLAATAGDKVVTLVWSAPADDGGTPVTGYEYRYEARSSVPEDTPWQSAELNLERTVTGLTNGQQYAFEVRARNRVGNGEARVALATPVGRPSAPASLAATAGDKVVTLVWSAPADDGGTPVTGYEYRYEARSSVPEDTPWQSAELNLERTVTGLTNGQQYAFEVRARNRVGNGEARVALATPVGRPSAPASLAATAGDKVVTLVWSAPADDGGTPVTGYEYRYEARSSVPEDTPWQSAELNLERTVTGLTNGQQYAFEVRARNRVGNGEARVALATPVGQPSAPASLTATAGDEVVVLAWSAPADDGGTPVTGYEYRYEARSSVPEDTPWQSAELNLERTVTGLTNGQQYAFEVRARNRVGNGEARVALATPVGQPSAPASLTATAGDEVVVLAWSAPADDGGTPVTGYEYRYEARSSVPEDTPWQSAGLDLEQTVTGLTNGQQYAFEVRARNRVGNGEARVALATPVGQPSAPASLTATAGDEVVVLAWSAPADDGGTPVTGYEYRYEARSSVPEDTPWQSAGLDLEQTVTVLENATRYAFEVRARNRVGPGETSRTTALPLRLRAELFNSAAAEGEVLAVGVRRSGGLAFPAHAYIGVADNAFPGVTATEEGRADGLGRRRIEFATGAAEATVAVTVAFDGERRQDRVLTVTLDSAETEVDGVTRAYEPVAATLVVPVTEGDAGLSVADARVQGTIAVLAFTVSMDRTRNIAVQVDYATEDGSAKAGEDYTAATGTLTIEAGERECTVEVPVLPALHVTGERTLTLRLSNAGNAVIDDGVATGTIVRESELPKAWLARFGRTASGHVAQAIARRFETSERETHVRVAGRRLDGLIGRLRSGGGGLLASTARNMARRATSGLTASAARAARPDGAGAWSGEPGTSRSAAVLPDFGLRLPEVQEMLLGSSFYVQGGAQQAEGGGKAWAAWGDVATTHFEADAGGLGLNGDVTTGTVGLDGQWRKLLVGLALARSGGEGAYDGGAGTITSTLTSVHPYMRFRLAERAHLWGATGWGRGGLRLTPGNGAGIETDLNNSMAALGGRALLRRAGAAGSPLEIALRSDMLWTSTSSNEAGVLAEATGTASRGRLMLEGAGRISGLGGVLRPSVEGGLRYDGGDAETGAGLEVGGGLDWARGGLALKVNGRMLLAHADESYEEWGYSGSLIYEPGADGRGLRMRLGSSTGAAASGVQSLWALENTSGLGRGGGLPFKQRFDAEVGFGLGGSALWYPYLATDASGQKRFGLRLNAGRSLDVGLELGRMDGGNQPPKDALVLRGDVRF